MIVYLHGFNSSPQSNKAQYLKRYLQARGKGDEFRCPQLPHLPDLAIRLIESELEHLKPKEVTLIGSSLGGFYSTWLAEKRDLRAVLINPAIDPHLGLRAFLGPQQVYHGRESYELTEEHLRQWEKLFVTEVRPERYLLLVETGDEVLDYRVAAKKYRSARQVVVQGGDHTLASFPEHVPAIMEFAGMN